jgi:hypothetical protein
MKSMHTCMLDLLKFPAVACLAHIISDLALHSLVSVVTFCNAGCEVSQKLDVPLCIKAAQFCAAANACALDCG